MRIETLRVLTAEQRQTVKDLAKLEHLTILTDSKFGQAWQVMRARRSRPGSLKIREVMVMQTIGSDDVYVLDGVEYEVVRPPQTSAADELISREQAEAWAGQSLSDELLDRLGEAIPQSGIPDAINTIVASIVADDDETDPA